MVGGGFLKDWYSKLLWIGCGGGLLMLALSASLLTSSLCRKGVDGGGGILQDHKVCSHSVCLWRRGGGGFYYKAFILRY